MIEVRTSAQATLDGRGIFVAALLAHPQSRRALCLALDAAHGRVPQGSSAVLLACAACHVQESTVLFCAVLHLAQIAYRGSPC